MKKQINRLFFGKSNAATLLVVLAALAVVGLGCRGNKGDVKPPPAAYQGYWEGQDGSTISIRGDGTGDYRSGSTKVEGGTAEVNEAERTVSITFFGIGKTLKIDQPPAGDQMQLDGVVYRRRGGGGTTGTAGDANYGNNSAAPPFSSGGNSTNSSTTGSGSADSSLTGEAEALVKSTLSDFANAVESEDFSDFRSNASRDFQRSHTAEKIKTEFKVFLDKKEQALPSLQAAGSSAVTFTDGPRVHTERGSKIMTVKGRAMTRPYAVQFDNKYVQDGGEWKLLAIEVEM